MTIYWSLLVCFVGLILFIITPGPACAPAPTPPYTYGQKANVIAIHMFWVGLLVFLIQIGPAITGFANHR